MMKEDKDVELGTVPSTSRKSKPSVGAIEAIEEKVSDESCSEENEKEIHSPTSDDEVPSDHEKTIEKLKPRPIKKEPRLRSEDVEQNQKSILKGSNAYRNRQLQEGNHEEMEQHQKSILKGSNNYRARQALESEQAENAELNQRSILKGSNNYRIRPALDKRLSFEDSKSSGDTIQRQISYNQNTFQSCDSRKSSKLPDKAPLPTPTSTRSKFHKSFYWLAINHRRLGISHIAMIVIMCCYALIGATIFYFLEHKNEIETMEQNKATLLEFFGEIAVELEEKANLTEFRNQTETVDYLKNLYVRMLEKEGIFKWTTFYKDQGDDYRKWHFSSSVFFVFNTFTTTGYGAITPETTAGKLAVIIYATIVIPLTLVVLRDLGQLCLVYLTKLYAVVLISWRRARALSDVKDDEIIRFPMSMSMATLALFLLGSTIFVHELDDMYGPEPGTGVNWLDSLYFAFISLTAIGYGELMPNNVTFHPLIAIVFFLGMPLMKVVNRVTYVAIENGVFGTMTVLENRLDAWMFGFAPELEDPSRRSSVYTPRTRSPSVYTRDRIDDEEEDETGVRNEWLNNFTIRSIATFMKADGDVYAGGFGRVNLRRADLLQNNAQDTVRSNRSNGSNR